MLRYGYIVVFFLLFISCITGYAQITIGQFFQSTERAAEIQTFTSQLEYLSTKPYRLAPIQKLEFRTKSNQLDPARQDYALRINPANPWEVRNSNNYFKEFQTALLFEKEMIFKEALIERYTMVGEILYLIALKKLRDEKRQLTDTQVAILEKQRGSSFFDAKDFLELKVDQMTNMVELEEVQYEIDNQAKRIAMKHSGSESASVNWESESIISVTRLEQVADSLLLDELPSSALAYREQKIRVATAEYKLEKSNIGLGYIQTQYQQFRTEQDREPWNIAIGVTIPLFNPNKGDMAKKQLDVIESQQELNEEKMERQAKTKRLYEKLKGELTRHRELEKKIGDLNNGSLAKTLQTMDSGNPIIQVQFSSNLIKLKILQAKLWQSILLTYTEFLAYTDRLQKRPLVNYLSKGLDETGS